jgi:hypothetical protein
MEEILLFNSYKLYSNGTIFSLKRQRFLKPSIARNGYYVIGLRNGDVNKTYYIHRLVAKFFLENINDLYVVDHIDRNKLNNNKDNLRWVSQSLNCCNRGKHINNNTGYKYICYSNNLNYYILQIKRNGIRFRRCCKDLQPLINFRNNYLDEINDPYPRE